MNPQKQISHSDILDEMHAFGLNKKGRVIYLHSELEAEESGVDFRMAVTFLKNLDYLNSVSNEPITIKMGSFGGCWNYGMMIYDAMKLSKSPINIECYAHSRSMSSIIPQAAEKRYIAKHCDFMIHYGTYGDEGDHRKVINGVIHYDISCDVMINLYVNRCINGQFAKDKKMTPKQLFRFLKRKIESKVDWWMNSEEAVYYGFMDKVLGE